MSYGEIKAYFIGPKARYNGCSCSESPKDIIISMENVHRLSPCGRVEFKRTRKI